MKILCEITYHVIGGSLESILPFEDLESNHICRTLNDGWKETLSEEFNNCWQEWLSSVLESVHIVHGKVYTDLFEVDVSYTTDYLGEVDCDWYVESIAHREVCGLEDYLESVNI